MVMERAAVRLGWAWWTLRYWVMDKHRLQVALAVCALSGVLSGATAGVITWWALRSPVVADTLPIARADGGVSFIVAIVGLIVSALVAYAMRPKIDPPSPFESKIPVVEDGKALRRIYGTVWTDDSNILAWKNLDPTPIRKRAGKSITLKTKWQTVGYWYHPIIHLGLHQGPFDALLRIRGGDVDAWQGEMTASGSVYINAQEIWGGEDQEGGMVGAVDVLFGDADQQPNAYLQQNIGPDPSGHRGVAAMVWKGGRYGAMSAYPKPLSIMTRRILRGWDRDICWYPEVAPIAMELPPFASLYFAIDLSGSMDSNASNGKSRLANMKAAILAALDLIEEGVASGSKIDIMLVGFGNYPQTRTSIVRRAVDAVGVEQLRSWVSALTTRYRTYFPAGTADLAEFFSTTPISSRIAFFMTDGEPSDPSSEQTTADIAQAAGEHVRAVPGLICYGINIDMADTQYTAMVANAEIGAVVVDAGNPDQITAIIARAIFGGLIGMNAAHAIYDSLVDPRMQGEPVELVNDASFRAAALRLYSERFGLCTAYDPDRETLEQFRQRLCDLIGAQCSRSSVNGQWYLDLIRGDYDIEALPVLTDDDILEFQDDPSVLDDAVNQVAVQWFDPLTKQDRITAPVHSLGAVQAMGSIVAETNSYPEIPVESLADRVAGRDLRNKSTPQWRKTLKTNRRPYAWRVGTQFRLMAPRHGVADMVCLVGEIDKGTLRSGAISMVALQDVFGLPDATYVIGQPAQPGDSRKPEPAVAQRVFEAPYRELVSALATSELQSMGATEGYMQVMGESPGASVNYRLEVVAGGGDFEDAGEFDWTPTALTATAVDRSSQVVTLEASRMLDRVRIGTAAMWGEEIVVVQSIDVAANVICIGRGCVDTVPIPHPAGSRIWFFEDWSSSDGQVYAEGQEASARLLTRSAGRTLDPALAPASTLVFGARAARPYPPANVRVNGAAVPENVTTDMIFSWNHRDRVAQGARLVDANEGDIGPEPGTTYTVQVVSPSTGIVIAERVDVDGTTATISASETGNRAALVRVFSVRDGQASYQAVEWEMSIGESTLEGLFFPLTYDEFDSDNVIQLERVGGLGPHITPRGFEGDGYEARYKTAELPVWLRGGAFTLQASISAPRVRITSSRNELVALCTDDAAAHTCLGIAMRADEKGDALVPAGALMLSSGANLCFLGRPGWRYELRVPHPTIGAYTAKPQALHFLDADTLMFSIHLDDTESVVYRVRLSDGAIIGEFTFGQDTYRHVASIAAMQNGDVWAGDYETGTLIKLDVDASFASGKAVILRTCASSNLGNGVGAIAFKVIAGVEYLLQATYDTQDTGGLLYLFPVSVLEAGVIAQTDRYKRFQMGRRMQGITTLNGKLIVSRNNRINASSPGGTVGWLQEFDIDAFAMNQPDGTALGQSQVLRELVGPSSYVEDVSVQPGTNRIFVGTEGGYSVADTPGFQGVWSGTFDPSAAEVNCYSAFFDGEGVSVRVNGYLFATLPWVPEYPAEVLAIGGLPAAMPGFTTGHSVATISNVAIVRGGLADSEAQKIASGAYEAFALDVHEVALNNAGAELGNVSGWTTELGGMAVRSANPAPYSGAFYFSGGNTPQSRSRQRVAVDAVPVASIDAGSSWARLRWQQSAYSAEDPGTMGVRMLTATENEISTTYAGSAWTPFGGGAGGPWFWLPRAHTAKIPASTRRLDALYFATGRTNGTNNDHYVDEITLTVYTQAGSPKA